MPSNKFQYSLTYMYDLKVMPFEKNQDCCHGSRIGYQNRMIQAIMNFHAATIPPTKFRFNLTQGLEKMVFDGYQDSYNGSHIIYSNGTGIAFMNVHAVLDSYRFIIFLHLTPGVSPIFPYYVFQRLISCRVRSQSW